MTPKTLMKSFFAGACIGLAGCVKLSIQNPYLGAIMFAIGLMAVCLFEGDLFTGKACYDTPITDLLVIFVGNALGAISVAGLCMLTRFGSDLQQTAVEVVSPKILDSPISLVVLGIICNIFIYFGVEGYKRRGTLIPILFAVPAFILCGSEHSIADIFYFAMAVPATPKVLLSTLCIAVGNYIGGFLMRLYRHHAYCE